MVATLAGTPTTGIIASIIAGTVAPGVAAADAIFATVGSPVLASVGGAVARWCRDFLSWLPPWLPTTALLATLAWRFRPAPPARVPSPRDAAPPPTEPPSSAGSSSASVVPTVTATSPLTNTRGRLSAPRRPAWRHRKVVGPDAAARWCDAIARQVRSGASLSHAIDHAERPTPIDHALRSGIGGWSGANDHPSGSTGVAERLTVLVTNPSLSPDLRLVLSVLTTVARLGGPAAEPIDRAGVILRARAAAAAERASQSAQARLSAVVMTLLPIAMLALLLVTSPSVRTIISTPVGITTVGLGITLNVFGWWWMHRIISGGQR